MSGLRLGSLFFSTLEMDVPIRQMWLKDGAILLVAILEGPARLPAGTFPATVYDEDGRQVAVMTCTVENDLVLGRRETAAVKASLQVISCATAGS